jgi:hypothetical protein
VPLKARAGLHVGEVTMRETPAADVLLGAKPVEVDGVSKPIAARVMSTALGGQTLITAAARDALGHRAAACVSHGHWRVKGLPMPLELLRSGRGRRALHAATRRRQGLPRGEKGRAVAAAYASCATACRPNATPSWAGAPRCWTWRGALTNGARLVSLLGIGGGGKTRLATRFGWVWMGDYPGGVWFCDLAPARSGGRPVQRRGAGSAAAAGRGRPGGADRPRHCRARACAW